MFWVTVATLVFPGFAQGLVHRRRRMALWLAGSLAIFPLAVWLPWAFMAWPFVHVASAIDGYRCYMHDARPGGTNRAAAAIAVVVSAVGLGVAKLCLVTYQLPSSSGYPTLQIGDHVLVNKLRGPSRGELIVFVYPCEPQRDYVSRVVALAGDSVAVACGTLFVNGTAVPRERIGDETYIDSGEDFGPVDKHTTRYRETDGGVTHDEYVDAGGPDVLLTFPTQPPSCERAGITQVAGQIVDPPLPPKTGCEPKKLYVVPPGHVFVMGDNRSNANDSRVWGSVPIDNVIGRLTGVWMPFGRIGNVN